MKNKIITYLFVGYLTVFSILGILFKDKDISYSERRNLSKIPKIEFNSNYVTKLDKYFLDQFPFRDSFRMVKASYNYKVLNMLDNNNIYVKDNYIFKSDYPTDLASISKFNNHIEAMKDLFSNSNIYTMIIPDKNYYLDDKYFLNIDYDYIYDVIKDENIGSFIDIRDIMELSDYYETDTHWKEEKLNKVILKMSSVMNFSYHDVLYEKNIFNSFYGVYYGQAAINRSPEKLVYLTSSEFTGVTVKYLEDTNFSGIYNEDKLNGLDSYDVYLDGANSLIEITNSNVDNKSLLVFRDSFGSSLVPLLIPYYSKITVVDNRYINSSNFMKLIDSNYDDVLFLYSTLIVNNSGSLKN
mgnify:FL=1